MFTFKDLESFKSFSARIEYCNRNLERISSGSSRIVYKLDDKKVLKLAKNPKGIAQCEIENQWGNDGYYGRLLANASTTSEKCLWVEMEYAEKLTEKTFEKMMGVSFDSFKKFVENFDRANNTNIYGKWFCPQAIPDKDLEKLQENDLADYVTRFIQDSGSPSGDFCRISTYGIVNGEIVVIDYGLTWDIVNSHYS